MATQCIRCLITGRVQGVFFRAHTREQAQRLNLCGWARNLSNGSVMVLACGEPENLEKLHTWLRRGPPLAQVEKVTCLPAENDPEEIDDFYIG